MTSKSPQCHSNASQVVNGQLEFIQDTFQQLKPGLSSYDSDADSAAKSLDPLLKVALESVPEEIQVQPPAVLATPTPVHRLHLQDFWCSHLAVSVCVRRRARHPSKLGQQPDSAFWTAASPRIFWQPYGLT